MTTTIQEAEVPEVKRKRPMVKVSAKSKLDLRREIVAMDYAKHYPECSAFHVCSDFQVFLKSDLIQAHNHQNEICDGQQVLTVNL